MIKIVLSAILLFCVPAWSYANVLGSVGKTFPFAERDALSEVEDKAKQVDWKKEMDSLKEKVVKRRPEIVKLPRTVADRVRRIDMSYTLDIDIPDPRDISRVLYPKGFSFNPLQYMTLPGCVVFADAGDRGQMAWLRKNAYVKESASKILLTGGDIGKTEQILSRPLFYADPALVERFEIMAVPSVACQKGVSLEIHEILVP